MNFRLLPMGDAAVLVELDDPADVLPFAAALRSRPHPDVTDIVPAEQTVLVRFAGPCSHPEQIGTWLRAVEVDSTSGSAGPLLELDVVYDGADLAEVARLTGLSESEVIAAHTGSEWVVAFSGFVPGFGYLRRSPQPGDEVNPDRLWVPRRDEPRPRVPAGAVGLAAGYSGVYPRVSPGGWQLIGHTEAVLWDADRDPPALLRPGVRVGFRQVHG
jgi:KipI family sensor histidine kinase inhibitor